MANILRNATAVWTGAGKDGRGLRGNIVGAGLGAVTPFCSCSTSPVTVGLLNAGAPFGAAMSFLVSSPILNPVILGLLVTLFGWKFAVFYGTASFVLAVAVGAVWQFFGLERDVKNVRVVTFKDVNIEELDTPDLRLPESDTFGG